MNVARPVTWPKVLVGLMAAAALLSTGWTWRQWPAGRRQIPPPQATLAWPAYAGSAFARPAASAGYWPEPPAPSSPADWLFETFTPPLISYDPQTQTFAVTAPRVSAEDAGAFGLELQAVRLEPFRVQLAGYFGGPGRYVAVFVSPSQPGTTFLRVGGRSAALGVRLDNFKVAKAPDPAGVPGSRADFFAEAVVYDERAGQAEILDNRTRKYSGPPLAVLRPTGPGFTAREVREGETLVDGRAIYRVEHIQLDPAEVVVTKQIPGRSSPLVKVLQPVESAGATLVAAKAAPVPVHPVDTLATNSN